MRLCKPKLRFIWAYCIARSHETNSISATTAKALVVEVPGVDHRMMSPIGRLC